MDGTGYVGIPGISLKLFPDMLMYSMAIDISSYHLFLKCNYDTLNSQSRENYKNIFNIKC